MKLEFEYNENKLSNFFKSGIIVLSIILILSAVFYYVPQMVAKASGSNKKLPIYCVKTEKKQVALTFDAAWGDESTPKLLEILAKHKLKATFFLTGGWVDKYPEDVKAIAAAGHDIGNHSLNHKQMSKLNETQCKEEIMAVHDKVKALTGIDMELFRAPFGDYDDEMLDTVNQNGYHCIQWDVDVYDTT